MNRIDVDKGATHCDEESSSRVGTGFGIRREDTGLRDRINAAFEAIPAIAVCKTVNDKQYSFDFHVL